MHITRVQSSGGNLKVYNFLYGATPQGHPVASFAITVLIRPARERSTLIPLMLRKKGSPSEDRDERRGL